MSAYFNEQVSQLNERANEIISSTAMLKANRKGEAIEVNIPQEFKVDFFHLVDQVTLSLMEEKDNFYGYFLFQMMREIKFDMASPTGVNFKGAKYVMYFNPLIFLNLTFEQMAATMKHEILHIISLHLVRVQSLKGKYTSLAINMAMDLVVNQYLSNLPPYATTIEQVNNQYHLELEHYATFEYYVEKLQLEFNLQEEDEDGEAGGQGDKNEEAHTPDETNNEEIDENTHEMEYGIARQYSPEKTHEIWEASEEIEAQTLKDFTEKFVSLSQKGQIPAYLGNMIAALKNSKGELPWNLYLARMMGSVESHYKKTITRRNRRQPERLDLRGNLRSHKAEIAVAFDISGSISDEEFKQAVKEVLQIVKNYNHEITIIECDDQIRRAYKVKSIKDIKDRMNIAGGTRFTPVFEYANKKNIDLLIYFTDGKGEERLKVIPRGYKVLWVISGRGEQLSLSQPYGAVKKLSKVEVKDDELDMSDVRSDGYSMNNQAPGL